MTTHATITWLGEGDDSPSSVTWCGIEFPLGIPIVIDTSTERGRFLAAKALNNEYFQLSIPFDPPDNGPVKVEPPPEPLPEMPEAPPLQEQLKAVRKRGPKGTFLPRSDSDADQ